MVKTRTEFNVDLRVRGSVQGFARHGLSIICSVIESERKRREEKGVEKAHWRYGGGGLDSSGVR